MTRERERERANTWAFDRRKKKFSSFQPVSSSTRLFSRIRMPTISSTPPPFKWLEPHNKIAFFVLFWLKIPRNL